MECCRPLTRSTTHALLLRRAQVTLQAFWLPFAMLALSLVMGGNWVSDALGILAGHL